MTSLMLRPWEYVLTSTGRTGRLAFLACALSLAGLWALFDLTTPPAWKGVLAWLTIPLGLYVGACILSLRLHDRGRSGWWCWLILTAFGLAWPLLGGLISGATASFPASWRWIAVAVLAVALIDLAVLPGHKGFNRFGPAPRARI